MLEDSIRSLGIALDTDDREEIVEAVMASAVIRSADLDEAFLTEESQLRSQLFQTLGDQPIVTLRLPDPKRGRQRVAKLGQASVLARIWRVISGIHGVRLALEANPPFNTVSLLRELSHPRFVRSRSANMWPLPSTGISSIFISRHLQYKRPWGWPLKIGLLPIAEDPSVASRIRSVSMVQRSLASVFVLGEDEPECDLLISTSPMPWILGWLRSLRLELKVGAVASLTGEPAKVKDFGSNIDELHRFLGAGAFAFDVVPIDQLADWTDKLIRALSHNLPFDVALWEASAAIEELEKPRSMPILIADQKFLAHSILENTIVNLASRIDALPELTVFPVSPRSANILRFDETMQSAKELATTLRTNAKMISFDQESGGATGIAEVERTVAAHETIGETRAAHVEEPTLVRKLYADLTIFDHTGTHRIDDTVEPLVENRSYHLEVALRRVRTGVSYKGHPPQEVAPPPGDEEVELFVVISSREQDFDVPEPVQTIILPAKIDADSKLNANFIITPKRRTTDANDLACIEVRIFYELNLIEHLVLKAEVLDQNADSVYSRLGLPAPIYIEQFFHIGRSYSDIKRDLRPRQMSIDVRRSGDFYHFNFTFLADSPNASAGNGRKVVMHARAEISPTDLTRELNRIRKVWLEIAMERYATSVEGRRPVFDKSLRELALAGRDLWSLLFRGPQDAAMWNIGQWLEKHPPSEGSVIAINLLDGATTFVFPWSLLSDQEFFDGDDTPPDPKRFWGLRYNIEQKPANGPFIPDKTVDIGTQGLRLAFMVWASFRNAKDQEDLLSQFVVDSGNRLTVTVPPINRPSNFYNLVKNCDEDILYFYTHGYTRPVEADAGHNELDRVRQFYENMPDNAPAKAALKDFYEIIAGPDFKPDESWIALSNGRLYLRDLRAKTVRLNRNPIVILNMCQSAQVLPGISESFVTFFLDRKARSVIGTECPMTNEFAHPFSQQLFKELLEGRTLGEALRQARRYFIDKRNPLGLAYTLFGSATTRYDPAVLPSTPGAQPTP